MTGPGRRTRVALLHPHSGRLVVDEHLRVRLPAPDPWPSLADVLYAAGDLYAVGDGPRTAGELANRHPGALVAAVQRGTYCWMWLGGAGGCVLRLRAGEVWASLAHAWLVAGLPVETLCDHSGGRLAGWASVSIRSRTARAPSESARPAAAYRPRASR
ncbi:transcriptional regulator [Streptomyces sp. NPDC049837]|uniref:transcriptional regulator n=1 Tax=Streptomyces sp. NPDC049837 TaxID=3155277 RepID=UPI00344AD839